MVLIRGREDAENGRSATVTPDATASREAVNFEPSDWLVLPPPSSLHAEALLIWRRWRRREKVRWRGGDAVAAILPWWLPSWLVAVDRTAVEKVTLRGQ